MLYRTITAMVKRSKTPPNIPHKESKRLSEQLNYLEITNAVPALIGVYSIKTGEYLFVNDAVEKILGYTQKEFAQRGVAYVTTLVHPDDIPMILHQNQKALEIANNEKPKNKKEKLIVEFEYRMRHKTGHYIWLKTYGSVFKRSANGEVEQVLNVSFNITKRKEAEQRAVEVQHNKQISYMIEHMNDAFITHDNKGNYIYVNEKAAQMLKRDKKDFEGKNVWKLYPALRRSTMYDAVQKVITTKKMLTHEYFSPIIKRWLIANIHPTGEGVSIYFTDITERKKAEEKLLKSEERYRAFIEQSSEGIWRFELEEPISIKLSVKKQIDLFYKYAYLAECNEAFARMYGYDNCDDLIGARLTDFLPKNDPINLAYLTAFIRSGYKLSGAESHEIDKDKNSKYFENNLVGIVDNGKVLRAWGTQRDISELKNTENALRDSEGRLALALESSKMGIWDYDLASGKVIWSPELEKLFGLKPGEFQGGYEEYVSLIHPEDRIGLQKTINDALKSGKQYQVEHRAVWPDGSLHWILGMGRAYYDPKTKKPVRMTGASQNIDHRKMIEQRKDDFIGMASHELKTPVTSLKIFTQILRRQFESDGKKSSVKYLGKMDEQINKLTRLIRELLDVSKISAGKLQISSNTFDIIDLTKEIIDYFQETTVQKIKLVGPAKFMVKADRDRISQVIINLLSNSIKYSPKNSQIIIRIAKKKSSIEVSVTDEGVGISKDDQERIFERFYQVTSSPETTLSGLGMGLYIASQIIALHKGNLWVTSEKGKGSTFTFSLPI